MTQPVILPSVPELKAQAKRLRSALANDGDFIKHGEALELVARQHGYRDWNTLHAAATRTPPNPLAVGAKVRGAYLGQPFSGLVRNLQTLGSESNYLKISLELDEPVDVVTFDSFSSYRRRIETTIRKDGRTLAQTSDGKPHLELYLNG